MLTHILYPQRSIKFFEKNYFNVAFTGEKKTYLGLLFLLLIVLIYSQQRDLLRISLHSPIAHTNTSSESIRVLFCFFPQRMADASHGGTKDWNTWSRFVFSFPGQGFCQWNLYYKHTGRGLPWSVDAALCSRDRQLQVHLSVDLVHLPQQIYLLLHRDIAMYRKKKACFH